MNQTGLQFHERQFLSDLTLRTPSVQRVQLKKLIKVTVIKTTLATTSLQTLAPLSTRVQLRRLSIRVQPLKISSYLTFTIRDLRWQRDNRSNWKKRTTAQHQFSPTTCRQTTDKIVNHIRVCSSIQTTIHTRKSQSEVPFRIFDLPASSGKSRQSS